MPHMSKITFFKISALVIGGIVALFVVLQLIPIWAFKTNPPVIAEPDWDSPETRDLAKRACFDCHSNETAWPWYSNVAPASWLVVLDTVRGRRALNFSEWGRGEAEVDDVSETIQNGEMPPSAYVLTHSQANLTDAEKQQLIDGLFKTMSASPGGGRESGEKDEQGGGG